MTTTLAHNDRWLAILPEKQLTDAHLTILDRQPGRNIDVSAAQLLIEMYRRIRYALHQTLRCKGFMISTAIGWKPGTLAIGEPDPIGDRTIPTIHVFGRYPGESTTPVRAMARPRPERRYVQAEPGTVRDMRQALDSPAPFGVEGPAEHTCDGCTSDVLTYQERWRNDAVRVIRPRRPVIDSHVLVLPLRHIVSLADLSAPEVLSMSQRLGEVRAQFAQSSRASGLTCFANDGVAARQETPHVHLHVFGRSRNEAANPFEVLLEAAAQPQSDASSAELTSR